MTHADRGGERPIWARWRLEKDGTVQVVATYREGDEFVQVGSSYASIEEAAGALGPSFGEVVRAVTAAGGESGRWRP